MYTGLALGRITRLEEHWKEREYQHDCITHTINHLELGIPYLLFERYCEIKIKESNKL